MMKTPGQRSGRRVVIVLGTAVLMAGAATGASAEDGVQNFFSSIFGGGEQRQAAPESQPQPSSAPATDVSGTRPRYAPRALTVKLHRPKVIREAHVSRVAQVPSKPDKVSIFVDKTLRRGDAVMTRHGMRIFAGSSSWPYRDNDFVAVAEAGRMDKGIQTTLLSLDSLPRN